VHVELITQATGLGLVIAARINATKTAKINVIRIGVMKKVSGVRINVAGR
jgi:hypothetical protein